MRRVLTEVMRDYFDGHSNHRGDVAAGIGLRGDSLRGGRLPVSPTTPSEGWTLLKSPRRLSRTYEFRDPRVVSDFLAEVMSHESRTGHHAKITCEFPLITVEVRTHDLDDVTELDQDYAQTCDHIYTDVGLYRSDPREDFESVW